MIQDSMTDTTESLQVFYFEYEDGYKEIHREDLRGYLNYNQMVSTIIEHATERYSDRADELAKSYATGEMLGEYVIYTKDINTQQLTGIYMEIDLVGDKHLFNEGEYIVELKYKEY